MRYQQKAIYTGQSNLGKIYFNRLDIVSKYIYALHCFKTASINGSNEVQEYIERIVYRTILNDTDKRYELLNSQKKIL
jgi:hypothetical protein